MALSFLIPPGRNRRHMRVAHLRLHSVLARLNQAKVSLFYIAVLSVKEAS